MPRKADPIPVNLANWNKNKFKLAHKERFLSFLTTIEAISDACESRSNTGPRKRSVRLTVAE